MVLRRRTLALVPAYQCRWVVTLQSRNAYVPESVEDVFGGKTEDAGEEREVLWEGVAEVEAVIDRLEQEIYVGGIIEELDGLAAKEEVCGVD